MKDKHAIFAQSRPIPGSVGVGTSVADACANKTAIGPNIIKYPNLARLEQDNGKVAVDSDGNVIMTGDY
ncbi:MAG: hypothetical protein EB127_24480, partial [Alphaproteobacteria bacterium]|nr:hypothetical protein [Alphaproteobacteria bacterium]